MLNPTSYLPILVSVPSLTLRYKQYVRSRKDAVGSWSAQPVLDAPFEGWPPETINHVHRTENSRTNPGPTVQIASMPKQCTPGRKRAMGHPPGCSRLQEQRAPRAWHWRSPPPRQASENLPCFPQLQDLPAALHFAATQIPARQMVAST